MTQVAEGVCQRCDQPVYAGRYRAGLPPDVGRFTCIACLTPAELAATDRTNPPLSRLENALSRELALDSALQDLVTWEVSRGDEHHALVWKARAVLVGVREARDAAAGDAIHAALEPEAEHLARLGRALQPAHCAHGAPLELRAIGTGCDPCLNAIIDDRMRRE